MVRWLFVLATGCSTLGTKHTCSYVPPAVDTAVAVGGAALVVGARLGRDEGAARDAIVAGTALLIAFGVSAIHGFADAETCATRDAP